MLLVDRRVQEEREAQLLAPWGMRSAESRGRRYPEPEHPLRTCFQRDRDRVIHSSSFRRLEYKTQVFVNHEGDNYRTRLTHSLEGAQIGRTVARALGLNEELTECLVLGHDLGHTPFGHSGERVMNELMRDHGGFEHNRQTLRILEVLERRYPDFPGLNLTWEVREGIIKHRPDTDAVGAAGVRARGGADARGAARRLRGRDRLQQPRRGRRADLADVHGRADPRGGALPRGARRRARPRLRGRAHRPAPRGALDHRPLCARPDRDEPGQPRRGPRGDRWPTCAGRAGGSSAYAPEMAARVRELKDFLFRNMYRHYRVVRMGDKAGRLLRDLFDSYVGEPRQLPPHFQGQLERDGVHRVVCDYIAGMTDRFAVDEHQKLFDPTVRV